jgi:thymidylate synthase
MDGEAGYLALLRHVLEHGDLQEDRTGVGTRSVFGATLAFDLTQGFPLLTCRRLFWKGIVAELLFFLSGETDTTVLEAQGVTIWKGNTRRSFLDQRGLLDLAEGDMGAGYGFQWRHFGEDYQGPGTYGGVDQIQRLLVGLWADPTSRRHVLCAWNPAALHRMALPPCHVLAQFDVRHGRLSCQMYQRSADLVLGVPFNVASYALLTHLLAAELGLGVGTLRLCLGNAHIYVNHEPAARTLVERPPLPLPVLRLPAGVRVLSARLEDCVLDGYAPHPAIPGLVMAV